MKRTVILRMLAILSLIGGLLLSILGGLGAMNGIPARLWMLLAGLPTIGIGIMLMLFSLRERISTANLRNAASFYRAAREQQQDRICTYCGTANGADARFCKSCGAPLS